MLNRIAVAVAALAAASCTSNSTGEDACTDLWTVGSPGPSPAQVVDCHHTPNEVGWLGWLDCPNGERLFVTDKGWWLDDGTITEPRDVNPTNVADACYAD